MYTKCFADLENIEVRAHRQAGHSGLMCNGVPFTVVADIQAHTALPTLYIINAVSVLDDALKLRIAPIANPKELKEKANSLGNRILFLEDKKILSSEAVAVMKKLQQKRNNFAHEVGLYGSWDDLWGVLDDIKKEIKHLQNPNLATPQPIS